MGALWLPGPLSEVAGHKVKGTMTITDPRGVLHRFLLPVGAVRPTRTCCTLSQPDCCAWDPPRSTPQRCCCTSFAGSSCQALRLCRSWREFTADFSTALLCASRRAWSPSQLLTCPTVRFGSLDQMVESLVFAATHCDDCRRALETVLFCACCNLDVVQLFQNSHSQSICQGWRDGPSALSKGTSWQ